ncbi:serine/threonine-protein kinase/endoribonuclease IRE1b, partial [Tanacetum coccineum]
VFSFDSNEEDDLERRLKVVYPAGKIGVVCKTSKLTLNYKSGKEITNQLEPEFTIQRHDYEIRFSSWEPATIRWELHFSKIEAIFPNSECPCMVHQSRSVDEFLALCNRFEIKKLPRGRNVDDYVWMNRYRLNKIFLKDEQWMENKTDCFYEGSSAELRRFVKTGNVLHNIKTLRNLPYACSIIRFFGWQETADYYFLATEKCEWTFESYITMTKNTSKPFHLDIVRDLAKEVYGLKAKGIDHGDLTPGNVFVRNGHKPKLGLPSFMTQSDKKNNRETNLPSLGKLILLYTSEGAYEFDIKAGVTPKELKMCKKPEVRNLIEKLTGLSPPKNIYEFLLQPCFWDTHTTIQFIITFSNFLEGEWESSWARRIVNESFIKDDQVFTGRWDNCGLYEDFVDERVAARPVTSQPYDFTQGCSLVRIFRNAFGHHDEMSDDVRKVVGKTKAEMLVYFLKKFPNLLMTLHTQGVEILKTRKVAPNLRVFYQGFMMTQH